MGRLLPDAVRARAQQRGVHVPQEDLDVLSVLGRVSPAGVHQLLWKGPSTAAICADVVSEMPAPASSVSAPASTPKPSFATPGAAATSPADAAVTQVAQVDDWDSPPVAVAAAETVITEIPPSPEQPTAPHATGAQLPGVGVGDQGTAATADQPVQANTDTATRVARLTAWRLRIAQQDPRAESFIDWDINILAESGATTAQEIRANAHRLNSAALVEQYATQIAQALADDGGHTQDEGIGTVAPGDAGAVEGPWMPDGYFAPCDYSRVIADDVLLPGLQISRDGEHTKLQWAALETSDPYVVYRVIEHSSSWARVSSDDGQTLGVTQGTTVTTDRLHRQQAVSYLTVWANSGPDEMTARAAQGQVIAQGEVLWPIAELRLAVTPANTVVGEVTAPAGTALMVLRFGPGERVSNDSSHVLRDANIAESGFIDRKPPPAVDLTYAVFSVVNLPNGQRRVSDNFVTQTIRVDVEPLAVPIVVRENSRAAGTWDIEWADPGFGRVELYLTDEPVPHGLGDGTRSRDVLLRTGLRPENRIPGLTLRDGDKVVLQEAHTNLEWVRSYFTAVHVVGDDAVRVGPSISKVTPAAPREAQLSERVDTKILTFEWPRGVSMVEVHQTPRGHDTLDPTSTRDLIATIDSPDTYLRKGGLQLTRSLPPNGCSLHLVGVIYDQGVAIRSHPATVDYPGLARMEYRLLVSRADGAQVGPNAPADQVKVLLKADSDLPQISIAVVGNTDRVPLFPGDGMHLADAIVSVSSTDVLPAVRLPLRPRAGYVRLFVTSPELAGRVAVIDPGLHHMWLQVLP